MDEKQSVLQRIYLSRDQINSAAKDEIVKAKKKDLFATAAEAISEGVYYKIYFETSSEDVYRDFGFPAEEVILRLNIEQLRMKHMEAVYIPSEDIYLYHTDRSLKEKLRNCFKYLKDRSGGRIDWRETDEGI